MEADKLEGGWIVYHWSVGLTFPLFWPGFRHCVPTNITHPKLVEFISDKKVYVWSMVWFLHLVLTNWCSNTIKWPSIVVLTLLPRRPCVNFPSVGSLTLTATNESIKTSDGISLPTKGKLVQRTQRQRKFSIQNKRWYHFFLRVYSDFNLKRYTLRNSYDDLGLRRKMGRSPPPNNLLASHIGPFPRQSGVWTE